MLIAGPSGSGKSAAVRLIAAEANKRLLEWKAPVPTLWQDFNYSCCSGSAYTSKLDDFVSFITRASQYLPLSDIPVPYLTDKNFTAVQQKPASKGCSVDQALRSKDSILLLDDIPIEQDERVLEILRRLSRESQVPVVVIITRTNDGGGLHGKPVGESKDRLPQKQPASGALTIHHLVRALDSSGVFTVSFNPVTVPRLLKAMTAVARAEGIAIQHSTFTDIAAAARGDVRFAITGLQMMSTGFAEDVYAIPRQKNDCKEIYNLPKKTATSQERLSWLATITKRDNFLSMFHALGKILYNKRVCVLATSVTHRGNAGVHYDKDLDSENIRRNSLKLQGDSRALYRCVDGLVNYGGSKDFLQIHPSLCREWMSCDPEAVMLSSGMTVESVISFIHENLPELLCEDAIEDAAVALGYVSDSSTINRNGFEFTNLGSMSKATLSVFDRASTAIESNVIPELASGSIIARGVLFAPHPSRPAVRRWSNFKGPKAGRVLRAASMNMHEVRTVVAAALNGDFSIGSDTAAAAAETLPMLRLIASSGYEGMMRVPYIPARWATVVVSNDDDDDDESSVASSRKSLNDTLCAPRPGDASTFVGKITESRFSRDVLRVNVAKVPVDTPPPHHAMDDDIVSW
jgi:cell cycle checkpoint protein